MINFQDQDGRWISYFHIPRCGGSSILYGIFGQGLADPSKGTFFESNRRVKFGAYHYNDGHGEFADHFPYSEAVRRGFKVHQYSMAIVRNPWQSCVSRFLYVRDVERRIPTDLSFKDWLLNRKPADDNSQWRAGGWHQQYEYLIDEKGKIVVSKIYKLEEIDIFNLFENLLGRNLMHRKLNVLDEYDYKSFYETKLKDEVAKIYDKDIELFGYSFD